LRSPFEFDLALYDEIIESQPAKPAGGSWHTPGHRLTRPNLATITIDFGLRRAGARRMGGVSVSEHNGGLPAFSVPRQATIEGLLEFPGQVVVAGTIEGDVVCGSLIVTERGVVNGSVKSQTVTILGEVNGEIAANSLTLKAACTVTGDIFHTHLVLEDGCFFEGRSRRLKAPIESLA
jgi:cytoskeletal protein CcmA (bactofilin family)